MSVYSAFRQKVSGLFSKKSLSPVDNRGWHVILESFAGAWQRDIVIDRDAVLGQTTVFACITLIASDIGKLRLRLVERTAQNIWKETVSAAFSPVLRKPNNYQTRQQFIEQWLISKLSYGNAYSLKQRDNRGVVTALYILDPNRVSVLVSDSGDVFYQLRQDDLSQLHDDFPAVPATEIIHDRMNCLFHPLVGLSPIFACGLAATKALKIENNATKFFQNMSRPSGILTAPAQISDATALRLKEQWEANYGGNNTGKVAVLGDGLKYEAMGQNASESQLVDQLKLSAEQICSTFHIPAYMVGASAPPPYNNIEALSQQYYSQCLQSHIEAIEAGLDDGLGLAATGRDLGTEFDLDGLLRMDTATQVESLNKAVGGGILAPDEARIKLNYPPVTGGDTPYLQQQNYSLAALAKRDALADPFNAPQDQTARALSLLYAKALDYA